MRNWSVGKWKIYALSGTHRFDILNGRYRYSDTAIQIQIQRYRSESRTRAAFYAQMQQVARRQRIHSHIIFNMLKPQLIRVQITHGDIHSQMCVGVCVCVALTLRVCRLWLNFVCLIGRKFDKAESWRLPPLPHVGVVGIKGSACQAAKQKKCASVAGRQMNGRRRRWLEIKAEVKVESTLKSVRQMTSQPKAIQVNYAANVEKLLIKF